MSYSYKRGRAVKCLLPLTLVASALSSALYAADADQEEGLNVVTVTAQKRQENAQDTPLSINVLSAEQLNEGSIEKIDDLQYRVPNLQMSETGISTQMYVRGIGTGNNQGFEQSVGQYIDGIYYGRQQLIRMPFLDLERIEVLKGPQSILFGKNSIAGALNMESAKPSHDLDVKFGLQYQPDFGAQETTFVLSGPMSDKLAGRIAVRDYSEDGFVTNTTKNRDGVIRDDMAVRASFLWTPNDNVDVLLKIESADFDGDGRQIEIIRDDPQVDASGNPIIHPALGLPVNFDFILTYGLQAAGLSFPDAIDGTAIDYVRQADDAEYSFNELDNVTLRVDWDLGDYTFTSITGNVSYEFEEQCDCDYIGANVFNAWINEKYDQFSQEFRIVSPVSDKFDWVGGLFYQTSELELNDAVKIPDGSILGYLVNPALWDTQAGRYYSSDSDLWAAFFQGRWHLTNKLVLNIGGRYTSEEKTGERVLTATDMNTGALLPTNSTAPAIFYMGFGIENEQFINPAVTTGHNLTGSRKESSFTPSINLQFKADANTMYYGSITTGFKSGGFDARANSVGSWEFEEEEATAVEFGIKNMSDDRTVETNASLYRTVYDNLQVSQFDGVLGFTVGNAKETVVQGIEIDGRWLINDNLTMNYAVAFLDHEYTDFSNGNCYNRQVPDGDTVNGVQLCDYTGKSGQYTPEMTANVSFDYVKPISMGMFEYMRASLGFFHSGKQNVDVNLTPMYEIDAYTKVHARVAFESENWTVALFGKNLTDEAVLTYVGNVPLSGGTFGTNTFYGFVDRPRSYGVQIDYNF
ncbi:MAG: TonB-dependent receptor [Gammaproteobacteria bacterium]|nr:TonB-dependent receptor [Gammaproteobacteria bacterium]